MLNVLDFMRESMKSVGSSISELFKKYHYYRNVYRSQLMNARNPFSSCFPTCASWFLQNMGLPLENADDIQSVLNGQKYQEWVVKKYGQSIAVQFLGKYHTLWEAELDYINNRLNERKAIFKTNTTTEDIKIALKERQSPVIVGTSPRYNGQTLGHIMLIVGYLPTTDQWIVDDPFGDFRVDYTTGHDKGDDIVIDVAKFEKIRGKLSIYMEGI